MYIKLIITLNDKATLKNVPKDENNSNKNKIIKLKIRLHILRKKRLIN